jgi:hypothetical protein
VPIDVMPALREGDHLVVPERDSDGWVDVDPGRFVDMSLERQRIGNTSTPRR